MQEGSQLGGGAQVKWGESMQTVELSGISPMQSNRKAGSDSRLTVV